MKKEFGWIMTMLLIIALPDSVRSQSILRGSSSNVSAGLSVGYDIGMPFQGHLMISNFAEDLPLAVRFIISQSFMWDPGIPLEARHVFINENNNGVPSKSATRWEFGLDLLYHIKLLSFKQAFVYGGIHYSHLAGTFEFIGGDEVFNVYANQWGLAGGVESYFRVNAQIDLFISAGVAYFFPSTLEGHDAAYSPDGEIVNQRQDYTYTDADHAINQPKLMPKLLMGFSFYF